MHSDLIEIIQKKNVILVAVSKTRSVQEIMALYQIGQRVFGENRVQELISKKDVLPNDIQWHLIGHLQKNKVKQIVPFISLIHSIDSFDLMDVIQKEAGKINRVIDVLLQFHIAEEESKFGLDEDEAIEILEKLKHSPFPNIRICGVMGMASFTDDTNQVRNEFRHLRQIFNRLKVLYFSHNDDFKEISMGMSGDFEIAISEGSTMVRLGSILFN